jgi:signal transduction histidine kinase
MSDTVSFLSSGVNSYALKHELELASSKYHVIGAWIAIFFDPLFAFTDYINMPDHWLQLLIIRLSIAAITLTLLSVRRKYAISTFVIILVPFLLISLQNAYTYSLISNDIILGHSLNYMALLIGGAMFILWRWTYSVFVVLLSAIATSFFVSLNPVLDKELFFVRGGFLLIAVGAFMIILINARYDLTIKEIKARLALRASNEAILVQAEEIKTINENLEKLVQERTAELEKKNKALEEYAFINAHKLRSPVASILGLITIFRSLPLDEDGKNVVNHLEKSTSKLDDIVSDITRAIEKGD